MNYLLYKETSFLVYTIKFGSFIVFTIRQPETVDLTVAGEISKSSATVRSTVSVLS